MACPNRSAQAMTTRPNTQTHASHSHHQMSEKQAPLMTLPQGSIVMNPIFKKERIINNQIMIDDMKTQVNKYFQVL